MAQDGATDAGDSPARAWARDRIADPEGYRTVAKSLMSDAAPGGSSRLPSWPGCLVRRLRHDHRVPRISEFYGIVIEMYFVDHPPPHFHARYSGDEALIVIASGEVFAGSLPGRVTRARMA